MKKTKFGKEYTTREINRDWKIKVNGIVDGVKVNILVGIRGLLHILGGSWERLQKLVRRAYASLTDKCECKVYNGPRVTFYAH